MIARATPSPAWRGDTPSNQRGAMGIEADSVAAPAPSPWFFRQAYRHRVRSDVGDSRLELGVVLDALGSERALEDVPRPVVATVDMRAVGRVETLHPVAQVRDRSHHHD